MKLEQIPAAEYRSQRQESPTGFEKPAQKRGSTSPVLPDDVVELTPAQPEKNPLASPSQAVTPLEKKALLSFSVLA
ncbi:hypothetical protein [Geobacter sp. SVR]|uniref:hypothetical protein n=1 Tax=Geobacter sp. SVR TaxID=2495594 RepID=UPI00143EF8E2|nr:hypothetical protein [Geobacter sp. SVR]BCS53428.1 hypothetical protein GSVR_17360 [Geobacter sp. SVR]GCF85446.1 hypothetical protein GSbR_20460 [Geobacter sp. SVR]